MYQPVISGTGVFTPEHIITNQELVESFNAYVDLFNAEHAQAIAAGEIEAKEYSSTDFIFKASGIEQRYVLDKEGVLDPARMYPRFRQRSDDEPGLMSEIALAACETAMAQAGIQGDQVDLVICAASNIERAYPAVAIEIQKALGAGGFAFDMNVACSSATFGIQAAADMVRAGSVRCAIVVTPELTSGHLEWRDRDCHFIFGDVATATVIQRSADAQGGCFEILSTRCATEFSNNIRNNNGFLRRNRPDGMKDRRDMQFMQNGRKVFKEVVPMVSAHILAHLGEPYTSSRRHSGRKENSGEFGLGLGFFIARTLLQRSGGQIRARNLRPHEAAERAASLDNLGDTNAANKVSATGACVTISWPRERLERTH